MNNAIFAMQKNRARSSVGSEHLVYTQGVRGSNPFAPTSGSKASRKKEVFLFSLTHKLLTKTAYFVQKKPHFREAKVNL